jgi:hypothetical protein
MEGIYLFGNEHFKWYKIGTSQNIERRFRVVARDAPFPLALVKTWELNRRIRKRIERALHSRFAPKRIKGEWFALDECDLSLLAILEIGCLRDCLSLGSYEEYLAKLQERQRLEPEFSACMRLAAKLDATPIPTS